MIITEKLDGSNVGIARIDGKILALGRAGYLAQSSRFAQHQIFAEWVRANEQRWLDALLDGERIVGEWMAQAHGTKYTLPSGPFAAFDLMRLDKRALHDALWKRCSDNGIPTPKLIHDGGPMSVEEAMRLHGDGIHGAEEPEGVVYRVERNGVFDFLAKWVRPDKVDGKYLPGVSQSVVDKPVWNWKDW
jgi:hypothetical protein